MMSLNLKDKLEDGVVVSEENKYILEFHRTDEGGFDYTIYSKEGNLIEGGAFMYLEDDEISEVTYEDFFDHINYVLDESEFDENVTILDKGFEEDILDMINEIKTYQFELATILEGI